MYLRNPRRNDKRIIRWTSETEKALEDVRQDIVKASLLVHPKEDALTRLVTDDSDVGMGAVLEQYIDGCWRPLAYYSKTLNEAQRNYSTYDRKLLAIF